MPYNTRHAHPTKDESRDEEQRGPSQSNAVRWPDAPEPVYAGDGTVRNSPIDCPACGSASTLSYRCSECGADLVGGRT